MLKFSCCIPGGSFMPQGEAASENAYDRLTYGYRILREIGYDCVEATVGLVLSLSDEEREKLKADTAAGRFSLPVCNSMLPGQYPIVTDEAGHQALYAYIERAFSALAEIGVKTVVFGSGRARSVPDGFDRKEAEKQIDDFLRYCDGACERYGLTMVIEPLNRDETNWVRTVAEGAAVVRRLSLPHIRLLGDGYHMAREEEPPEHLAENRDILLHTHLAAAPDRVYPGKHGGAYETEFLKTLVRMGYDGIVTVECGFSDFASEAKAGLDFLRKTVAAV